MTPIRKFTGIKDLLEDQRYRISHIQNELIKQGIPGSNWTSYMNVYNLVHGCYPNDAYTFVFLSELLNIDINVIISRYSMRNASSIGASRSVEKKEVSTEDIF
jgi:hypothetical protein